MDCVFHEATCQPSTSTIVLRGPRREYQLPRDALLLDGPYLLVRDRGRLAEVDDELQGRLIDLGVEEAASPPPRPAPRPAAKWTPRSRFLLHRNDGEPRLVYGDTLGGVYGVPKLWVEDYGASSMTVPTAERNLTHLGTGRAVTKQLVRICDMKCLGEALLERVPEVAPAGMPSAELLGRMKEVVDAYLETVDDRHKYELIQEVNRP